MSLRGEGIMQRDQKLMISRILKYIAIISAILLLFGSWIIAEIIENEIIAFSLFLIPLAIGIIAYYFERTNTITEPPVQ